MLNLKQIIIKKILKFPWKLLEVNIEYSKFLLSYFHAHLIMVLLVLMQSIFDKGSDAITLTKLKLDYLNWN